MDASAYDMRIVLSYSGQLSMSFVATADEDHTELSLLYGSATPAMLMLGGGSEPTATQPSAAKRGEDGVEKNEEENEEKDISAAKRA